MAGMGEACAILGLVPLAAKLSEAFIESAVNYKRSRKQIETLGKEIEIFGKVLKEAGGTLKYRADHTLGSKGGTLTGDITSECQKLFSELELFRISMNTANRSSTGRLRAKIRSWVKNREVDDLHARVNSMKLNILLMKAMDCPTASSIRSLFTSALKHSLGSLQSRNTSNASDNIRNRPDIQFLYNRSEQCLQRLTRLEKQDTAGDVQSSSVAAPKTPSPRTVGSVQSLRSLRDAVVDQKMASKSTSVAVSSRALSMCSWTTAPGSRHASPSNLNKRIPKYPSPAPTITHHGVMRSKSGRRQESDSGHYPRPPMMFAMSDIDELNIC